MLPPDFRILILSSTAEPASVIAAAKMMARGIYETKNSRMFGCFSDRLWEVVAEKDR
jgi:hypothetical protein